MAKFIGSFGALLLFLLIAIFFFQFFIDINKKYNKHDISRIKKYILYAIILGTIQIACGALISSLVYDNTYSSIFSIEEIWKCNPVTNSFETLNNLSKNFSLNFGNFSLYYVVVSLFSKILFNQTDNCALYISFFSGIITFLSISMLSVKYRKEKFVNSAPDKIFRLLMCLPGTIFLFLPSPFSLCIALLGIFLLIWNLGKGNKIFSLILAILCSLTHMYGIIALILFFVDFISKNKIATRIKMNIIISAIVCIIITIIPIEKITISFTELIVILELFTLGIISLKDSKALSKYEPFILILLIILNGFWITCSLM